jgi:hypothetical protein
MLSAVLTGAEAQAQSSNRVPAATDYAAFSRFVTDRNIFDPDRQPHYTSTGTKPPVEKKRPTISPSAPAFSLVGTMAYEKGMFAFFNGNSEDLKKNLYVSGKIANYTLTHIGNGRVTLETTNQEEKIELKVGDVMREDNGAWHLTGQGEVTGSAGGRNGRNSGSNRTGRTRGADVTTTLNDTTIESSDAGNTAPPSAGEMSDVLKRLMEKREQENK